MIGVLGVIIVAVAVGLSIMLGDVETPPPPPVQATQPDPTSQTQAEEIIPPSFDVVPVNPEGNAVMARRAHPGSRVESLDGDNVFGAITTDKHSEWVFVPETLVGTAANVPPAYVCIWTGAIPCFPNTW